MKKGKGKIKEIQKIKLKKRKNITINKQINQKEPDLWKEIRAKLQPLSKAYINFMEKRKITKQQEERRKIKEQAESTTP